MLAEFKLYTDMSLDITMAMTVLIYTVGLMEFLAPYTKKRITVYACAGVYAAVMWVMYFLPQEFSNLAAYGLAVAAAFSVYAALERENYPQKLFLAFSFFSVRWITAATGTSIYLKIFVLISSKVIDLLVNELGVLISVYVIIDVCRDIIMALVMHLLIWIFKKVFVSFGQPMSIKEALLLILPCISGVNNYRMLLYFNSIDTTDISFQPYDIISFLYYLITYAAMIVMIYFYEQIKAAREKEKLNAMLSVQSDNIRDYISGAENLYRDIRAIRHDMKNHLLVLKSLHLRGENEAFDDYLSSALSRIDEENGIRSGNPVTDVILTDKKAEADKRGVSFECGFHWPENAEIDALDISIILSNALNNATEAAEKCAEPFVKITSEKNKNAFVITVKNSFEGKIISGDTNGLPKTTKLDAENHGFGLQNIKSAAEKYHGGVDIECKNGVFILTVLLMIN